VEELGKVESVSEGEAQRYFDHAITLKNTVRFLRFVFSSLLSIVSFAYLKHKEKRRFEY